MRYILFVAAVLAALPARAPTAATTRQIQSSDVVPLLAGQDLSTAMAAGVTLGTVAAEAAAALTPSGNGAALTVTVSGVTYSLATWAALIPAEATRAEAAEALLAPLLSPALTGVPTAPTAAVGTSTAQLATTAFVAAATAPVSDPAPANTVLAAPNGSSGTPTARPLVGADLPLSVQEVALTLGWAGTPFGSTISSGPPLIWPCTIPANFAGSQGYASGAATGSTVFSISYVHAGVTASIGTATLAAGASYPTFSTSASVTLVAGDVPLGASPSTPDATAANISLSILCTRS